MFDAGGYCTCLEVQYFVDLQVDPGVFTGRQVEYACLGFEGQGLAGAGDRKLTITVDGVAGAAVADDDLGTIGVIHIERVGRAEECWQCHAAGIAAAGCEQGCGCRCRTGGILALGGAGQIGGQYIEFGAVIKSRVAKCLGVGGITECDLASGKDVEDAACADLGLCVGKWGGTPETSGADECGEHGGAVGAECLFNSRHSIFLLFVLDISGLMPN